MPGFKNGLSLTNCLIANSSNHEKVSIFLLIFCACFASKQSNKINVDKVNISLSLDNCVNNGSENNLIFTVENNNAFGFWIDSWHLRPDSIYSRDDGTLTPNAIIESSAPKIVRYAWINPNSKTRLSYYSSFFTSYTLIKKAYILYSSYDKYVLSKKHTNESTLITPVACKAIAMVMCEKKFQ